MEYLKHNIKDDEFYNLLKNSINKKIPFAFTRFGDGEIAILNKTLKEKYHIPFCARWKYKYPEEYNLAINDCIDIIKVGIEGSDVIGLMDPMNMDKGNISLKYNEKVWSIQCDRLTELGIDPTKLIIGDHQISRKRQLGDVNEFKKILNNNPIHIITTNSDYMKRARLNELLEADITYTQIDRSMGLRERGKVLNKFKGIKEDIVIYGAAVSGKDFAVRLKEDYGKIALDFGATLDAWGGVVSRPWFRPGGPQEYCFVKINKS
jgi:hypothetical protein